MRVRHPEYHRFWTWVQEMPVQQLAGMYEDVLHKRSSLPSVKRNIVMAKGMEYEKLGIIKVHRGNGQKENQNQNLISESDLDTDRIMDKKMESDTKTIENEYIKEDIS